MYNLKHKVEKCLEFYPETRNSDITLTMAIWCEFHSSNVFEHNGRKAVYLADLMDLPREDNIKRARAEIQNVEHKFLPTSETVKKQRKINEEYYHDKFAHNNPAWG